MRTDRVVEFNTQRCCRQNGSLVTSSSDEQFRNRAFDVEVFQLREAIKHNPNISTARFNLGIGLSVKGDLDAAIIQFKNGIKLEPKYEKGYGLLAAAYLRKKDTKDAIDAFNRSLKIAAKPFLVHYTIATLYYKEKKFSEGITSIRAAIKDNPNFDTGHAMLGDILMQIGDVSNARIAITEAVRLNSKWKILHKRLPPITKMQLPVKAKRPRSRP